VSNVDDLDAMLERAAPEPVGAGSPAARSAWELAADVGARRPRWGRRWGILTAVAGALVLAGGATAVAAPALFDWSWGSADTLAVQEFPVGDDAAGRMCVMALWAEADPGASADLNAAVEKAQAFLHQQDWSALDSDTANLWVRQRQALIADGSATPPLLASLTAAQVRDELADAGLIVPGVSVATRIDCGDGAAE
jgi:hypothetical protein